MQSFIFLSSKSQIAEAYHVLHVRYKPLVSDRHLVQILQRHNAYRAGLHGGDAFDRRKSARDGSDARDMVLYCRPADGLLVKERLGSDRRIDEDLNLASLDEVHDIGTPLHHLINCSHLNTGFLQELGGTTRSDNPESDLHQLLRYYYRLRFVSVLYA